MDIIYENQRFAIRKAKEALHQPLIIFDTETTGLGEDAQVVEIAAVDLDGNVMLDTLINPTVPVPAHSTAIHGIRDADLLDAPTIDRVLLDIDTAFHEKGWASYNLDFDLRLLNQSLRFHGQEPRQPATGLCIMLLYAEYYGDYRSRHGNFRNHQLGVAATACGVAVDGAHRALADARMALGVLKHLASRCERCGDAQSIAGGLYCAACAEIEERQVAEFMEWMAEPPDTPSVPDPVMNRDPLEAQLRPSPAREDDPTPEQWQRVRTHQTLIRSGLWWTLRDYRPTEHWHDRPISGAQVSYFMSLAMEAFDSIFDGDHLAGLTRGEASVLIQFVKDTIANTGRLADLPVEDIPEEFVPMLHFSMEDSLDKAEADEMANAVCPPTGRGDPCQCSDKADCDLEQLALHLLKERYREDTGLDFDEWFNRGTP